MSGTALLLIDVINDLAFEGSAGLVAQAEPMALRLSTLKRRAAAAGIPTIYINDNFGQWRSDFRQTVAHCTSRSSPGRRVSQRLRPTARDYFVLKPKHSGFFGTTLDTLLEALRIRRVILTGIAGNICVLFTANDAYMRDLEIVAPADLHCLEHDGRQRPCPSTDRRRPQGQRHHVDSAALSGEAPRRERRGGVNRTRRSRVATLVPTFQDAGARSKEGAVEWIRDRALTLVLMAMFLLFLVGQVATGFAEYNAEQEMHGQPRVSMSGYFATGHPWEALFENWESEFLQMAVFVLLTTALIQKGSPESRRPKVTELVDTDPRDFASEADAPWPVRRGGWILRVYEHSLGLAFILLFLMSWIGHALGGFAEYAADQAAHHHAAPTLTDYLTSARFWFESFQNWQSEFLAIASMVWLAVYLRQRWSPESKPVHAPHAETGR